MSLARCATCGAEWSSYTTHEQQHYCRGTRVFRRIPSHDERHAEAVRLRDPYEVQRDSDEHMKVVSR